eukprot:848698-Rhodomonas_salina.3
MWGVIGVLRASWCYQTLTACCERSGAGCCGGESAGKCGAPCSPPTTHASHCVSINRLAGCVSLTLPHAEHAARSRTLPCSPPPGAKPWWKAQTQTACLRLASAD